MGRLSTLDPLFSDAAKLVVEHQKGQISLLQRKLHIDYNRASFIMRQLGWWLIVGLDRSPKPREVCVSKEKIDFYLEFIDNGLIPVGLNWPEENPLNKVQ